MRQHILAVELCSLHCLVLAASQSVKAGGLLLGCRCMRHELQRNAKSTVAELCSQQCPCLAVSQT